MAIIDSTSNSGVKAGVSSYSWNHTVGVGDSRMLVVAIQARHNADPNNLPAITVTAGGVAMKLAVGLTLTDVDGGDSRAEIWYLHGVSVGIISIAVTLTGTCDHASGGAVSVFQMQNNNPDYIVSGSGNAFGVSNPSLSLTTTVPDTLIVDSIYNQDNADFNAGTNQVIISQLGVNGGGDRSFSSYKLVTTRGSNTMSWTPTGATEKWVGVSAAFKTARNVKQPFPSIIAGNGMSRNEGAT